MKAWSIPDAQVEVLRARFPNPERRLLPGQFVRGRILIGETRSGVTVPTRAVQLQGDAASVTIVGNDGIAVRRSVILGTQGQSGWLVLDGIQPGERVVTDGWQALRPGQKVEARSAVAAPAAGR